MGTSSSRLRSRPRPSRPRVYRAKSSNLRSLICGSSSSRYRMKADSEDILVSSAGQFNLLCNDVKNPTSESSFYCSKNTEMTSPITESRTSSQCSIISEDATRNNETSEHEKCFSMSEKLISLYEVRSEHGRDDFEDTEATFRIEQRLSGEVSVDDLRNEDASDESGINGASQMYENNGVIPRCSSNQEAYHQVGGAIGVHNLDSDSVSNISRISITSQSPRGEANQGVIPDDMGFTVSNNDRDQGDNIVVHVDMLSLSSDVPSSSRPNTNYQKARRYSRGLFRDTFSRPGSRRHSDLPISALYFTMDDSNGDFSDDEIRRTSRHIDSRIPSLNGRQQHSRPEILEQLHSGLLEKGHQNTSCPWSLHSGDTCYCESFLRAEDSSTSASISRIALLAEALFEVLDDIHQQPASLSLPRVSLPAPKTVVDSFHLMDHKKVDKSDKKDTIEQCYICLAEYEEGDKIRVLPCRHEYHMSCVDKWLKEIHGICPVCRRDVCDGNEALDANSEVISM